MADRELELMRWKLLAGTIAFLFVVGLIASFWYSTQPHNTTEIVPVSSGWYSPTGDSCTKQGAGISAAIAGSYGAGSCTPGHIAQINNASSSSGIAGP